MRENRVLNSDGHPNLSLCTFGAGSQKDIEAIWLESKGREVEQMWAYVRCRNKSSIELGRLIQIDGVRSRRPLPFISVYTFRGATTKKSKFQLIAII